MADEAGEGSAGFAEDDNGDGDESLEIDFGDISDEDAAIEDAARQAHPSYRHAVLIQEKVAEFLCYVKEICLTTEIAIENIVCSVDTVFRLYNQFLKSKILDLSEDDYVKKSDIESLFDFMDQQTLFEGVQTLYKRKLYQDSKWKCLVPTKVVLSWKRIILHGKVKEIPDQFGYYVDFLKQLEAILQCDDILECIDNPKKLSAEKLCCILDGQYYQTHHVKVQHPNSTVLAFNFFVDDVSPGEALTSYQGNNFRNYLWTLANIPPELRASLRAINIFAIAKASVAKGCNNEAFLRNFTYAMNRLSSDEGVTLIIKQKPRVFHGFCLCGIGDYPASGNIGGFKESTAKTFRPCRQCMITQPELDKIYFETQVTLRTKEMHEKHVQAVENNATQDETREEDEAFNVEETPKNPSVLFGVNARSPLLKLENFNIALCLPQDVMHLFLEGILSTACRLLIKHAIEDKKMKLSEVNDWISHHDFGKFKTDKPSLIKSEHLKHGLRQSSSQVLMLSSLVLFIVREHCDVEKQRNFVLLLMIFGLCISREVTLDQVVLLRDMIGEYLMQFNILYPDSFVSKHHFLIHLPSQIIQFGPCPETWAMRFEAYHAQLKRLHKVLHSAKNSVFSLFSRTLTKQAYLLHHHGPTFLSSSVVKAGPLHGQTLLNVIPFKECVMSAVSGLSDNTPVSELSTLEWYGQKFENGCVIKVPSKTEDIFAAIVKIYFVNTEYVLIYRTFKNLGFCVELHAFQV
ncbi:NADPH-dependent 7-cyano-7-deazaguanine reductase [Frankliniella fusca]|uniref:NADPH-dependent 7-cyano-7-deazaguanine reductase n=1 Tax=Frankliniella fusca TaxID=407009 RepID=A0AAE1LGE5_9NEOP|nr:NADPH-dependent 7-cyano-7-deazaguanine reductase [Frankliniella fusca]